MHLVKLYNHLVICLQEGRKYNLRQTTFGSYISDLLKENKTSFNSYLAVQNIKKALPELLVSLLLILIKLKTSRGERRVAYYSTQTLL